MKVKCETEVVQSCPTLSDPMDCSPPGSSVHGIFQARVLEWVAIAFSKSLQHYSSKASILQCSAFFNGPTLTPIPDYWENHSFNHTDLGNSMKKHYLAHLLIFESEQVAHSIFSGPLVKFEVKTLEKGRKKARISLE